MAAEVDGIQQVYDWRQAQYAALGSRCFALAGLILSPLLAALFDADAVVREWHAIMLGSASMIAAIVGVVWHASAARLHDEFLASVTTPDRPAAQPAAGTAADEDDAWF